MIHHELGYAYIIEEDGTKVAIDSRNPRDMAILAEEGSPAQDAIACAIEAVRDWLAWIFEAGPHPVPVMRRLVACTTANAPWLMECLPTREARAISAVTPEADSLRIVCHVKPADVQAALARAYRREGRTWSGTYIATLEMRLVMESAIDTADTLIRARAIEAWLGRVWDSGPRLGEAMKNLFVEARSIAPELILNMSGEEIASLFQQGRAAESARVKRRVNDVFARAGFRYSTLRFQKSATACRKYAERAKGNKNRSRSVSAEKPAA